MLKIKGKDFSGIEICSVDDDDDKSRFIEFIKQLVGNKYESLLINYNPDTDDNDNKSCNKKQQDWILTKQLKSIDIDYINYDQMGDLSKYMWGGYVGRIRDQEKDIELMLSSRLDTSNRCFFLSELIRSYVNVSYGLSFSADEMPIKEDEIFDFLKICVFRNKLIKAFNSGFFRRYTYFEGNDERPKGRIDIARHIRLNGNPLNLDRGRIAYEYREYTFDNDINHLILRTWIELRKAFPLLTDSILSKKDGSNTDADSVLGQLMFLAPRYMTKPLKCLVRKAEIPISNELFFDYDELRKTCIDILGGLDYSLFDDNSEDAESSGIVFFLPDLWEVYLYSRINDLIEQRGDNYYIVPQKEVVLLNGLPQKETDDLPCKQAPWKGRPDFILEGEKGKYVFDAKCKPGWNHPVNSYYLRDDIIQILSYGEMIGSKGLGVLFPFSESEGFSKSYVKQYKIGDRESDDAFLLCGLCVPSQTNKSFVEWKNMLDKQVECIYDLAIGCLNQ